MKMENKEQKNKFISENRDEILGRFEMLNDFYSIHLKNERDIIVWLPPSYTESNSYYPVLYMHDGQNLFNPRTSFIGYDWKVDETATWLFEKREAAEFIVVGIYNTNDRLDEYNFNTAKGKLYARFLTEQLKPFIDENYRTKKTKADTAVMGSSMGGLISFQLAWNFPAVFGKAACMSNSFWVDDKKIFESVTQNSPQSRELKIYIDCGLAEKEIIKDNKKMCRLLRAAGFRTNKNLMCNFVKGARHSEYDWAARLEIPLKFLFGKDETSE